jgi:cyclophilin family peptidyl-prolyl cis-trans isomerase
LAKKGNEAFRKKTLSHECFRRICVLRKLIVMVMMALACVSVAHAKKKPKPTLLAPVVTTTPAVTAEDTLVLQLSTGGNVRIQLRPDKAPGHVERIKTLSRAGFYDGLLFHRVIEGFMAQTGDPQGNGQGGSPLPDLKAEFNELPHLRGTLSMARAESNDSANSQFFICFLPAMKLDNKYTVLGRVISGMEFVDAIERGEPPATPSRIVRAFIQSDGPNAARVPLAAPAS